MRREVVDGSVLERTETFAAVQDEDGGCRSGRAGTREVPAERRYTTGRGDRHVLRKRRTPESNCTERTENQGSRDEQTSHQ